MRQDAIRFEYSISPVLRRCAIIAASRAMAGKAAGRYGILKSAMSGAVMGIGIGVATKLFFPQTNVSITLVFFAAGHLACYFLCRLRYRKLIDTMVLATKSSDSVTTTFAADQSGLKFHSDRGDAFIPWQPIEDITMIEGGILLRVGASSIVLPVDVLPGNETAEGVVAAFNDWRANT